QPVRLLPQLPGAGGAVIVGALRQVSVHPGFGTRVVGGGFGRTPAWRTTNLLLMPEEPPEPQQVPHCTRRTRPALTPAAWGLSGWALGWGSWWAHGLRGRDSDLGPIPTLSCSPPLYSCSSPQRPGCRGGPPDERRRRGRRYNHG